MFIYTLSYNNGTMKTTFAILGIIAAVGLLVSIATPSAFALTQSSGQAIGQSSSQGQGSVFNLGSPQTSVQGAGQSNIQAACVFVSIVCG
jgi:hypothetical protein